MALYYLPNVSPENLMHKLDGGIPWKSQKERKCVSVDGLVHSFFLGFLLPGKNITGEISKSFLLPGKIFQLPGIFSKSGKYIFYN